MRASLYPDKQPAEIRVRRAEQLYDAASLEAYNVFSGEMCDMFLTPRDLRVLARECLVMADKLEEG